MPRLALFDLDRTVLSVNSANGWIRRELRLGFLSRSQALRGIWEIGKYRLGHARLEDTIAEAVRTLSGSEEEVLRQRTLDFWREEVRETIRPGAREAVERHRAAGDRVVLLTSSSNYMCEAISADLPFDDFGCNRFEVQGGRFTGRVLPPMCFGPGKIAHAERLAQAAGLDLAEAAFYTDSYSDLPALLAVGEPVVVHPDPRLLREAKKRGWAVQDWGG